MEKPHEAKYNKRGTTNVVPLLRSWSVHDPSAGSRRQINIQLFTTISI